MEKKTIGGLIAALRKANGMTQKELAERLNVSDKTVSRWECDDGSPDLATIPVIAEIFGITCDELLRGERTPAAVRTEAADEAETTPKAEKQRKRLLKSTLAQYTNRTYIAAGISVAGVMVALVCNFAFLSAVLGFFLGAIFFVAAVVCQAVFVNKAFFSVEDAGLDDDVHSDYKRKVIALAEKSVGLTVAFIGFTFPLLLADAFVGLGSDTLLLWGAAGAAVFLLVYAVVLYFLNASFLQRGVYSLSEKQAAVYDRNHALKRKCAVVLIVLLAITFVGHQFATAIWGPYSIMQGTTFEDYESFIAYMEQDVSAAAPRPAIIRNGEAVPVPEAGSIPTPTPIPAGSGGTETVPAAEAPTGQTTYYDRYGNEISEEEALTRRLEDENGNVVCQYLDRNESVVSVRYAPQNGTVLPITVFTEENLQEARRLVAVRHVMFGAAYCVECLAVVLVYFKKRAK